MADPVPIASNRFRIQRNRAELFLPYGSNRPIDQPDPAVKRILISLHGSGSHGMLYLENGVEAAQKMGVEAETLVIAPQFAHPSHLDSPPPHDMLLWMSNPFWGDVSVADRDYPRPFQVSSFEALDLLLAQVLNRHLFPNLLQLVLVGHSGGGQFVNRYAASSRMEDDVAGPICVRVHYVPINPGNYMYLDNRRPATDGGFAIPSTTNCAQYDNYGLGLSALDADYHIPRDRDAAEMQQLYRARRVTYLVGLDDNDPNHDSLPKTCGSNLQGAHRLERARNYMRHVEVVFGSEIRERHRLVEVAGVGHWGKGMMTSTAGIDAIFAPLQDSHYHSFELNPAGGIAARVEYFDWSDGWTQAKTFTVGGAPYLFLLKEATGDVHIHALGANGRVGVRVTDTRWSSGWTTVSFFYLGGQTYLFLLKAGSGQVHTHGMNLDGTVGPRIETLSWTAGWTQAQFYRVAGAPFLFLLKEQTGQVHIHGLNVGGTIGTRVAQYDWSSGWTSVAFYYRAGMTYMLLLKRSNGQVHLHRMNLNGSVGTRIDVDDWTSGWTTAEAYSTAGASRLLFLKESTGRVDLRQINPDGTLGVLIERRQWTPGWTSVAAYAMGTMPYLLAVKARKLSS